MRTPCLTSSHWYRCRGPVCSEALPEDHEKTAQDAEPELMDNPLAAGASTAAAAASSQAAPPHEDQHETPGAFEDLAFHDALDVLQVLEGEFGDASVPFDLESVEKVLASTAEGEDITVGLFEALEEVKAAGDDEPALVDAVDEPMPDEVDFVDAAVVTGGFVTCHLPPWNTTKHIGRIRAFPEYEPPENNEWSAHATFTGLAAKPSQSPEPISRTRLW